VVLYDRRSDRSYAAGVPDAAGADQSTEIRLGGELLGDLSLCGARVSDTALQSIGNLAAIALERARSLEAASRAEAARQSEELKSMLLDAVTHEFKTPLTSIKAGATALLADDSTLPAQRELLTVIDEETDRINAMITEAIQVARVEAGGVQLNRASHRLPKLVAQAVARLRPILAERPLEVEVPADLPSITADADLVCVVISQLLDNAIKYSPAGAPITLAAWEDSDAVVVTIADRGPGIAPEDRERVFERFYRGPVSSQVPGTGVGLSIAREIVRVHGGRIWVESGREGGACFVFTLPLGERHDGNEHR
jgi:two-component system sensor histidine kinase KdpD